MIHQHLPTHEELEFMRISPAITSATRLALNELRADAADMDDVFYELDRKGCMVDVYVKLKDGRTAIGTAFAPALSRAH